MTLDYGPSNSQEGLTLRESPGQHVIVVTIHDKEDGFLTFDIKEILEALGSGISELMWIANIWDWEGDSRTLPDEGIQGAVMTTDDLFRLYRGIHQTLAGEFAGVWPWDLQSELCEGRPNLRRFSETQLRIGILAVECDFFVIWSKEQSHVEALRNRFSDVRVEEPDAWCDHADTSSPKD